MGSLLLEENSALREVFKIYKQQISKMNDDISNINESNDNLQLKNNEYIKTIEKYFNFILKIV